MSADSKGAGDRYHGGDSGIGKKLERWNCGGEHLKRNCPKSAKEKEEKKDDGSAENKRADRKLEVKVGQLHSMLTSLVDLISGTYFSDLE